MICEQPGHLIHSPSGTRLAFASVGAIGVRAFLNQAMKGQLIKKGAAAGPWSFGLGSWSVLCPWSSFVLGRPWSLVVPGPSSLALVVERTRDQGPSTKDDQALRTTKH